MTELGEGETGWMDLWGYLGGCSGGTYGRPRRIETRWGST